MALHYELPVYKACYDLLLEVFRFTKGFSKEYKYTVGESLKKETMELLTLFFRANSRKDKAAAAQHRGGSWRTRCGAGERLPVYHELLPGHAEACVQPPAAK
jgi:hypothetical protein